MFHDPNILRDLISFNNIILFFQNENSVWKASALHKLKMIAYPSGRKVIRPD